MKILITGGAGFIGSRLAARLAGTGADVTILDNLSPQIHGAGADFAPALKRLARCVQGDVRDKVLLGELIADQGGIVHLAAETGTAQSMYAVEHYSDVNIQATAGLLDIVVNKRPASLRKLVVASSRAIYGEGRYQCPVHGKVYPPARTADAMSAGQFEPVCPICGGGVRVEATDEVAPYAPTSFYGLTKQVQEQMTLIFAGTLGLDACALRYQNVYGPGQSLTNPYTGILAIFSNLVRQGKGINIFEDGLESRDFVYIDDVVEATASCVAPEVTGIHVFNVGSGVATSVLDVANAVVAHFKANVPVTVTGDFRLGDIRHNFADISAIAARTGFHPQWSFRDGLAQFLSWAEGYASEDAGFEKSLEELKARGLMGTGKAS